MCSGAAGDGAGVCKWPNDGDQISKDRTQPNYRGAGAGVKGQRGGRRSVRSVRRLFNAIAFMRVIVTSPHLGAGETQSRGGERHGV